MHRLSRGWIIALGATGVVLLAVVVLLANLHWFRGPIERAVAGATGRETHIRGELQLSRWFPPRITLGDVSFANAPWSKDPQMLTARRLELAPRVWRIMRGQFAFRSLGADGLRLILETDGQNRGNWVFEPEKPPRRDEPPGETPPIQIDRLALSDSSIEVREPALSTQVKLDARSEDAADGSSNRLRLTGTGRYRDAPFELDARIDLPKDIDADEFAADVAVEASAGDTHLSASGRLPAAITTVGARVKLELKGQDLGDLYHLVGIALPETPPYSLAGTLGWQRDRVEWRDFEGRIGDSHMQGDVLLVLGVPRPRLTAKLRSSSLDFDDLGTLLGIPPSTGEGETASRRQKQTKAELAARKRVLPTSPFSFAKLHSMDADVTLDAQHVEAPKLPVDSLSAHVLLDDGLLRVEPLTFHAASGTLATRIVFDARRDPLGYELGVDIRKLKLSELVPKAESLKDAVGLIDGRLVLKGTGNSVAAMFASANGDVQAIMGGGEVSNLLLEVAGLDVAESLKFLLGKDHKVAIRCAYADFRVVDGVAGADALALDTTDTALLGKGSIDLREERFDLTLLAKPKDKSPISLRSPLKIGGTFLDPSFAPEAGPLLLRGAAVAALAAIAPPAALLGLLETGPGHDVACGPGQRAGTAEDAGKPAKAPPPAMTPGPRPVPTRKLPDKV